MPRFCDYKNAYSKKTVMDVLAKQKARYPEKKFRAYECPICGKWHITHRTNWSKRKNKEYRKQLQHDSNN